MNEIAALRYRLADAERREREIDLQIDLDMSEVRERLDPFEEDATKLRIEEARLCFDRLYAGVKDLKAVRAEIARYHEALA